MMEKIQIGIKGMHCASCVGTVSDAIKHTSGVVSVSVNLALAKAEIAVENGNFNIHELERKVRESGYGLVTRHLLFDVNGMDCPSCVDSIRQSLIGKRGIVSCDVNYANQSISVQIIDGLISEKEVASTLSNLGYTPKSVVDSKGSNLDLIKLAIAGLGAIFCFVFGHELPYLALGVATVVQFWCGLVFHLSLIRTLVRFRADMNTLISLGTNASYFFGAFSLLTGAHPDLKSGPIIIFVVLLGRFIDSKARNATGTSLEKLIKLKPKVAKILRNGQEENVSYEDIVIGDVAVVRSGEAIPCDGFVESGSSDVDQSMMTGESMPIHKKEGDSVYAGTINLTGVLEIQASVNPTSTVLSKIINLVREAQSSKTQIEKLADRVCALFVPVILGIALVTFFIWLSLYGVNEAIFFSVSVLIIACPCALGLATPTAVIVSVGKGAQIGILFKNGETIEKLSHVDVILFDKTGTVTLGKPRIVDKQLFTDDALRLTAALSRFSNHPLSKAIAEEYDSETYRVTDIENIGGLGIKGKIDGKAVLVGSRNFMEYNNVNMPESYGDGGKTTVYSSFDSKLIGQFRFEDKIRPESAETIKKLKEYELALLSGDSTKTVEQVGAQLGIAKFFSELMPQDKVNKVKEFKAKGKRVAFVGDGINDAPSLAESDVGIAISGQEIAIEASQVVIMNGSLAGVAKAIRLAKRTFATIKQNLWWAFGYNLVLVPAAAGVLYFPFGIKIDPMFSCVIMAISSITVVLNSLRLRLIKLD